MTDFLKMHGLGNDFAVFDARNTALALTAAQARAIADRRTGIGCDQVIVIGLSEEGRAQMRIFNADGSEVESCGNAARCVAALLLDETGEDVLPLDTLGGPLLCRRADGGRIAVDIGPPHLGWREIPLRGEADTNAFALPVAGREFIASAVNVGNPHCVLFVPDADKAPVAELGPLIEHHALFPARVNVEFVHALSPARLRMRVWERGAGITRACGTGACACAVAAARRGLCGRKVEVVLDGGTLEIEWRDDDRIVMTGPVALSFRGQIDLEALA